jgi:hypothetical protein
MEQRQLKSLIENGNYRPEPELIARAMLRRRGVRTLLATPALIEADRIHAAATAGRRAA